MTLLNVLMAVAPLGALGVGAVLLRRGVRGDQIDDHPLCRHCGFDLTGRPGAAKLCSECGSDLSTTGAIRIGHRERRSRLLWAGGSLCAIAAVVLGAWVWAVLSGINLNPYKPLWILRSDAQSASGAVSDAALTEVNARLAGGKLSDAQITRFADLSLDVQADRAIAWNVKWGDFIENARKAKKLSQTQWKRYAQQAPDFQITFRPRVRRGDVLAGRNQEGPSRVGSGYPMLVGWCRKGVINVSGFEIRDDDVIGKRQLDDGKFGTEGSCWFDISPILDKLSDGPQTVVITAEAQVFDSYEATEPLGTRPIRFTGTFILTPADEPTVKVISDPSLRVAVERAVKVKRIGVERGHLYTEYSVGGPVGLSYEILMRSGGEEVKIGGFTWQPRSLVVGHGSYAILKDPPPPTADIIFRPNYQYPLKTIDIFEIWDGEIVYKDVPIILPTTAPVAVQ